MAERLNDDQIVRGYCLVVSLSDDVVYSDREAGELLDSFPYPEKIATV